MKWFFKKHIFLILFLSIAFNLSAQQNHFIYLQTENKQAFYVKLDKKILSSSATGYLIIPKLHEGAHTFTLGFPKNEWPEQKVTCTIDKKDAGYIVKNFGDKGWGLFNWQSMNVVMADKKEEEPIVVVKKEEPQVKITPPAVTVKEEPATPPVQQPINQEEVKPYNTVSKLLSNKTADGIEMIFTDATNGVLDTVRVFVPVLSNGNTPVVVKKEELPQPEIKGEKSVVIPVKVAQVVSKSEEKNEEIKAEAAVVKSEPLLSVPAKENPQPPSQTNKLVIQNSDCKAFATEDDFMKLRKKMAAEDNDDDMINTARKIFKTKCFTVEHLKNLSMLFLNDNGRYKFFDAAYPFVSDSYNFSNLQKLLTDEYYINRFKVMLRL